MGVFHSDKSHGTIRKKLPEKTNPREIRTGVLNRDPYHDLFFKNPT